MRPKYVVLLTALAAVLALGVVQPASAGNFDESTMGCSGENPATCKTGIVGEPYSLDVRLVGDEETYCATVSVSSGTLPPGLAITQPFNETKKAVISGTPTEAGRFEFFLNVHYDQASCAGKGDSQDVFIIPINPAIPSLALQPEQSGVPPSTVGAPFSLQMTSNLPDAKTWAVTAGALPAGLVLDPSTGLISGTPTTAGTFPFTVGATLTPDPLKTPARSATKSLTITVRNALTIAGPGGTASPALPASEVGVPFEAAFTASGGNETYSPWTLATTSGPLPRGLVLSPDGTISGTPRVAGRYPFTLTISDTEVPTPRVANYTGVIVVAARLDVVTQRVRPGKVGKLYRAKLVTSGGVKPTLWKIRTGPLPRGLKLDRKLGVISGTPKKAGRYVIVVEATDSLRATSSQRLVILVADTPKKTKKK
jgi:hypothetical protein